MNAQGPQRDASPGTGPGTGPPLRPLQPFAQPHCSRSFPGWDDGAMDAAQLEKVRSGRGFFAALGQSGGSTPKALASYGIDQSRYGSEQEMFDLVHAMRTRVITDPAFDGSRILGAILFEQ